MNAFASGLGEGPDLATSARRAVSQALEGLNGRPVTLAVVYVCGDPEQAEAVPRVVDGIAHPAHLVGCLSAGVMAGDVTVAGRSAAAVWLASLPGATLQSFHLEVFGGGPTAAVVGLPRVDAHDDACLVLADPWSFPADGFLDTLHVSVPGLPVVGGMGQAAEGPGSARLFTDTSVHPRGAVGVVFRGLPGLKALVSHGCRPIGPSWTVTGVEGPLITHLAGEPAIDRLRDVVSGLSHEDQALATVGVQIGVPRNEYGERDDPAAYLMRPLVGAVAGSGALRVAFPAQVGQTVRFLVADPQSAQEDLERAARACAPAAGVLVTSCDGRLSHSASEDAATVARGLPGAVAAGLYAGGEIGPVEGRSYLHGQSAALLAFPA